MLLHALAKKPEERFGSISDFARAFEQALLADSSSPTRASTLQEPDRSDIPTILVISEAEALTGTNRLLTLLGGEQVPVTVPAGTRNGQIIRVEGQVEPASEHDSPGALILPITIAAPEEQTFLSDATGDATVINSGSVTDAKGAGKLAPPSRATVSTETRNRRHGLTALLLVGLAVLVAVGSSVGVFYFTRSNQHNPYPPYGTLALDDPLSDNSHGYNWLEGGDSFGTCAFTGKAYHVNAILDNATKGCFEDSSFRVAPSVLAVTVLSSALQTGRCVRLHYRSARSQVTERVFDPYGVVYHEGAWYTIGYCHLRQGQRLFRLDRIQQIEVTGETFSRPADFQALEAIQHALASVPRVWQVEVWLETTLEEIQHKTRLSKAQFEEVHNGVLLRGDVEDLPWMARFLAGLGVPLIIHRPAELRTVLRQYALTLASYAEHIEA